MNDSKEAIARWEGQVAGLKMYPSYQEAVGIDGEAIEETVWWRYQSVSSYVRCACTGVFAHVVVPERGCFVASCCLVSAKTSKTVKCKK